MHLALGSVSKLAESEPIADDVIARGKRRLHQHFDMLDVVRQEQAVAYVGRHVLGFDGMEQDVPNLFTQRGATRLFPHHDYAAESFESFPKHSDEGSFAATVDPFEVDKHPVSPLIANCGLLPWERRRSRANSARSMSCSWRSQLCWSSYRPPNCFES